jgi:hypothetical protein
MTYYYQILTDLNRLKIMSEVALLLPNTDGLNRVEINLGGSLLFTNNDRPQQGYSLEVVQPRTQSSSC